MSCVPTGLSVAAATCFCSVFAIIAYPAHANEQSAILVDFRSSFVCLGRVSGKFGRWRWKVLVKCANAPVCRGCCVFLFRSFEIVAQSARANERSKPWSMFDRRFGVSGALLFFWWGAGGAFLGEIWSLETEDACRVCPRLFVVAVACCCLSQLSCNLPVPKSAPNSGQF